MFTDLRDWNFVQLKDLSNAMHTSQQNDVGKVFCLVFLNT